MAMKPQMDIKAALGSYTLSKFGRKRPAASKRPRDRLVESLGNQIEIIHVMKAGRNPKEAGFKAHRMFFEHQGRYIVQIKYTNTPLDITDDVDAVEVDTLDDVEDVMKKFMDFAKAGVFDEQVNRIAAEWAAKLEGKRGRKPRVEAA